MTDPRLALWYKPEPMADLAASRAALLVAVAASLGCSREPSRPAPPTGRSVAERIEPSAPPRVSASPKPTADAAAPTVPSGPCPPDMVFVDAAVCVDRFETSLVDDATGRSLSPYYPVLSQYEGYLRDQKYLAKKLERAHDAGVKPPVEFPPLEDFQRSGRFVARAVSRAGVVPNGYLTRDTAAAACRVAGKRLCTAREWRTACRGSLGTKYPYGERYQRSHCNLGRGRHPSRILFGHPSASGVDPRLNLTELDGAPLLRQTGESPVCASPWGKDAVYDMVGNLDEWVDDAKGAFLGGTYSRYTAAGCDAIVSAHPPGYFDYSTGARCCAAPESSAPGDAGASYDPRGEIERAERLIDERRYAEARALLASLEPRAPGEPRLAALYARAIDRDPGFAMRAREVDEASGYDAIKHLGGGSTITLRFISGERVVGAFKPAQTRGQSDYVAEIASWRLCVLLRCAFHVPRNEPVRLRERTFDALYGRVDDDKQRAYRDKNFADLAWVEEPPGERWLFGALEDWVPNLVELPIEHVHVYRRWLLVEASGGAALGGLDAPAIDAYTSKEARGSETHLRMMKKQMRGMTRAELARELSQMLAFDFLVGNWDRFSTREAYYGTNCHVADGRLVSIDNGAAFRDAPHPQSSERIALVERFSRQFVTALRGMSESVTLRRLFPEATRAEQVKFRAFWRQRATLLTRIASLEARHGSEQVLAFP